MFKNNDRMNKCDVLVILFENDMEGRQFTEEVVSSCRLNVPILLVQIRSEKDLR